MLKLMLIILELCMWYPTR